jgi:catechol 2,3-dioxygenase-like lactoylglutathione lyase family enzyme
MATEKLRNRLVNCGFRGWVEFIRLKRRLANLGRPHLRRFDHVTIPVHDLDEACRFYCDILGATYFTKVDDETFRRFGRPPAPRNGEGAHHVSLYLGGPTRLDLFFQTRGQPSSEIGHPHIAFEARPSDVLYWKERLQSSGIPVEGPLQLGPPGQASLYFNDPFGNHLEITCMGFWKDVQVRPPSMPDLVWHPGRGK